MGEAELVERCKRGERQAQHELYTRTSQSIYRVLERMTGSADAAFDLAQDTFIRAFTRIHQFDGRSSIATWTYRIAVTEALQYLRRNKLIAARTSGAPADAAESHASDAIARLDVQEALAGLDPADCVILLLRYQEGLDYRAIAQVLDCAAGTVGSRLNRARQRLREILAKDYAVPEGVAEAEHLTDGAPTEVARKLP